MKRLRSSNELISNRPLVLVGEQFTVFDGDLFSEFLEAGFNDVSRGGGVGVMDRKLVEFTVEEAAFDRAGLGARQESFFRADFEDLEAGGFSWQANGEVEFLLVCPSDELCGRVTPAQSERRVHNSLGEGGRCREHAARGDDNGCGAGAVEHEVKIAGFRAHRKTRSRNRGYLLFEACMALGMLTFIGLLLLKMSMNILVPRQWSLWRTVVEAHITYERSVAERIPFDNLVAADSPWPAFPNVTTETVEMGRLPGGTPINATVARTRVPSDNNLPLDGGNGTDETNPAAMKVWKVQSVISYRLNGRDYATSRTILRSQ